MMMCDGWFYFWSHVFCKRSSKRRRLSAVTLPKYSTEDTSRASPAYAMDGEKQSLYGLRRNGWLLRSWQKSCKQWINERMAVFSKAMLSFEGVMSSSSTS